MVEWECKQREAMARTRIRQIAHLALVPPRRKRGEFKHFIDIHLDA